MSRHPLIAAAERRRSGREVPPGASPTRKADSGHSRGALQAGGAFSRPSPKACACCGVQTAPLRQFWAQDEGTALCGPCSVWIENRNGPEYLRATYGERGTHIESKEVLK